MDVADKKKKMFLGCGGEVKIEKPFLTLAAWSIALSKADEVFICSEVS